LLSFPVIPAFFSCLWRFIVLFISLFFKEWKVWRIWRVWSVGFCFCFYRNLKDLVHSIPPTLLDAVWLQFGQALASNAQLRQCDHCGKWFEAGIGTGRRADAKFCSSECQIEHKSLQRSRKDR